MNIGLIGFGKWGMRYIETANRIGTPISFVCLSGKSEVKLPSPLDRSVPELRNVKRFWSYWEDFLNTANPDGVIIATPASTHYPIALACLLKGIPFIVEKPLALSAREAESLYRFSLARSVTALIAHQHLQAPAFLAMKKLIGPSFITEIKSIAGNKGPFRKDCSCLWDYAPHDISMISSLLEVQSATRHFEIEDAGVASIDGNPGTTWYFSGTVAHARFSVVLSNSFDKRKRHLEVTLSDGKKLLYDDLTNEKLFVDGVPMPVEQTLPLDNLLSHFINLVKRQATVNELGFGLHVCKVIELVEKKIKGKTSSHAAP